LVLLRSKNAVTTWGGFFFAFTMTRNTRCPNWRDTRETMFQIRVQWIGFDRFWRRQRLFHPGDLDLPFP